MADFVHIHKFISCKLVPRLLYTPAASKLVA